MYFVKSVILCSRSCVASWLLEVGGSTDSVYMDIESGQQHIMSCAVSTFKLVCIIVQQIQQHERTRSSISEGKHIGTMLLIWRQMINTKKISFI